MSSSSSIDSKYCLIVSRSKQDLSLKERNVISPSDKDNTLSLQIWESGNLEISSVLLVLFSAVDMVKIVDWLSICGCG